MFGDEFLGEIVPTKLYPKMLRNFNKRLLLLYLDTILYSEKHTYMDFWIKIRSDYHLNSIYISYCCFWLFVICYVIMYVIYTTIWMLSENS